MNTPVSGHVNCELDSIMVTTGSSKHKRTCPLENGLLVSHVRIQYRCR